MKRMLIKTASVAIAACTLCSMTSILKVNAEPMLKNSGLNYNETTSYDLGSCDSGYTSGIWISAAPGKDWSKNITNFSLLLIGIGEYSSGMNKSNIDYPLDDAFFTSLENTLKSARTNGTTVGIRLRYDDNGTTNPEPADFERVIEHIKQLGESNLLYEYEDVITFVETGLVGSWGEQWGGKYTSLEHKARVLNEFMKITPISLPLVVRTPNTFRQWLKDYCNIETTPQDMSYSIDDKELAAQAARVGLYNDGYMGSDSDLGTFSDRSGETAWISTTSAYGGEFSGNDEWRLKYSTWLPENAIPEMYYTNLLRINGNLLKTHTANKTYATREEAEKKLSEIADLYNNAGLGNFDYEGNIEQTNDGFKASWKLMGYDDFIFDKNLDEKLGVSCDNSAFYGTNVWQFIRSHIGYRFVLRNSELSSESAPGKGFKLNFTVENTGFSNAPKDKEAEIILKQGDITYTYDTDINAKTWDSGFSKTETLDLTLPKTMPGGNWDVYLRISNINKDSAYDTSFCTRFANEDLQFDNSLGANYMGSINISGNTDVEMPKYDDIKPAGYYINSNAVSVNENDPINLLDKGYIFNEDGHYGFTFIYKVSGINNPIQLGKWYAEFKGESTNYSSAYTTYGINTRNQELSEDGYYAMNIPFYGCAFNCQEATISDVTRLSALNINDSRNYWSKDTYTSLGGNANVQIQPIAFIEGGYSNYNVTYHLPNGDANYTGSYGFEDKLSQTIKNVKAVTALSLLDKDCPKEYKDENGNIYKLIGYTTKKDDKGCIINENFPAMGTIELYPYYELDLEKTDMNKLVYKITNCKDLQGVRYVLNDDSMTATVGDGSAWKNNSGYSGSNDVIIPAMVESDGKLYRVTEVKENAFYDFVNVINSKNNLAISDVVNLQKYIVKAKLLTYEEKLKYDMDKNGHLNITDLTILKEMINGEF